MAGGFFLNLSVLYLEDVFSIKGSTQGFWWFAGAAAAALGFLAGTMPGARISDRVGRKPVIFVSAGIGAVGMLVVAFAPAVEVTVGGLVLLGIANGAFLAVDWALMTDIIPRASAGRYMGLSNIVEAANGALASAIGGFVISGVGVGLGLGLEFGARLAMFLAVVAFGLGALFLIPVREPPRGRHAAAG